MNVAILICTFGDVAWADRAYEHASPSAHMQQEARDRGIDVRVILRHHPRKGAYGDLCSLAGVRNTAALEDGEGSDWLCFLDADDQLAPGYIDAMATAHRWLDDDRTLFAPALELRDPEGRTTFGPALPNRRQPMSVLNHCVIGTLVPRRLFLDVGGFGDEPVYEDWALFLRCVRAGASIVSVPDAVYIAEQRPGSRNVADGILNRRTYNLIRAEHERSL